MLNYEVKHNLPTVPTLSMDPDSKTCLSTANANSAAASPASFLLPMMHERVGIVA